MHCCRIVDYNDLKYHGPLMYDFCCSGKLPRDEYTARASEITVWHACVITFCFCRRPNIFTNMYDIHLFVVIASRLPH